MLNYPIEIIPKATYKTCLNIDDLLSKYRELLVLRLVPGYKKDYLVEGSNSQEYSEKIFSNTIWNLSMNLLGGKYKFSHSPFLPLSDAIKDWNGEEVDISYYNNLYKKENSSFFVCFYVKDIHKVTYPFSKTFETQQECDTFKNNASIVLKNNDAINETIADKFKQNGLTVTVPVFMKIFHRPNFLNYWHVTLDSKRPDNDDYIDPEEKQSSRDKKQMKAFKLHLTHLINQTQIDEVPYKIKRKDYQKRCTCIDYLCDLFKIE